LNKGKSFPYCSCYSKPYCYFKQLGVPGPQPLPVVGNMVTYKRFKVGVSRGATYLLVRIGNAIIIYIYIHSIYKLCIVIVPASPSIIHTCVHTHTHTHIPCAVHVLHIHTIHLFSCTRPHAPVSHLLVVVPLADGAYCVTIKRPQGLLQVSVVDAYMHVHMHSHSTSLRTIAHVLFFHL